MKAHQLITAISPELQQEILNYLQKETREAFNTALFQVGASRKLRPQYFNRKSPSDRVTWLLGCLKTKAFDSIAEQLFQLWLLKAKTGMLTTFLDAAGIKHDGKGQVDELPDDLDADKVATGVEEMLKDHPGEHIAVYLRIFQLQRKDGWPAVADALEKRTELKLAA